MKNFIIFFVIGIVISASLTANVEADHCHTDGGEKSEISEINDQNIKDLGNTICPVMGAKIDKNVSYVWNGERVYFCCPGCIGKFKKDPKKYLNKIEKISGEEH